MEAMVGFLLEDRAIKAKQRAMSNPLSQLLRPRARAACARTRIRARLGTVPATEPQPSRSELRDRIGSARDDMQKLLDGRDALEAGRESGRGSGLVGQGSLGRSACTLLSRAYDEIVVALWRAALAEEPGDGKAGRGAGKAELALVATGGWGREEVCPYSDIDFILLAPPMAVDAARRVADRLLYPLWDAGIRVGHAVRTPRDAAHLASGDLSTATALLDLRHVAGELGLTGELARTARQVIAPGGNANDFVKRLAAERQRRQDKFGDSLYLLEPNLKHGIGALRDIDTALWAAKARWSVRTPAELVPTGQLTSRQARLLEEAQDFLLMLRARLQLQAGRPLDQLTFEIQEAVAPELYPDARLPEGDIRPAVAPAVEALMQRYYLHARNVARLSDRVLEMARVPARRKPLIRSVDAAFLLFNGSLALKDPRILRERPSEMVRLFRVALDLDVPVYGHTKELIAEYLDGDEQLLTGDAGAARHFLDALVDPRDHGHPSLLEQMHQIGILNALMPEFGPCTCRVQHDLYHVYTVDQHQLLAVAMLKRLARGELAEAHPTATAVIREVAHPAALYLGTLLHDVGKPLGKGHADKGARLTRAIGERLGMAPGEVNTAEFLVRQHLTMAHLSQRRDLSDPEVIERFAERVGDDQSLLQLYLCTLCDTAMTAPGNLTAWKEQLLEELFQRGRDFLRGQRGQAARGQATSGKAAAESQAATEQGRQSRERVRDLLLRPEQGPAVAGTEEMPAPPAPAPRPGAVLDASLAGIDERLFSSLGPRQMVRLIKLAWLYQDRGTPAEIAVACYPLKGHSELAVVSADRHGLLATIAAGLAASRIDVLGAVIGAGRFPAPGAQPGDPAQTLVLDVFFVRDLAGRAIPEHDARWARFRDALYTLLASDIGGAHEAETQLLVKRQRSGLAPRVTPGVTTRIKIDNDASAEATVVEVFTQDRVGVLHAITRTLTDFGLDIHLSKVATEGEQVTDIFYVTLSAPRRKLTDPELGASLEQRLHAALDAV
jgi:[protein-PII] uridylyltransferase